MTQTHKSCKTIAALTAGGAELTSVTFEMRQLVRLAHSEFRIRSEGRIIRLARLESLRNIQSGKLVAME